jgi:hypothetical protein
VNVVSGKWEKSLIPAENNKCIEWFQRPKSSFLRTPSLRLSRAQFIKDVAADDIHSFEFA